MSVSLVTRLQARRPELDSRQDHRLFSPPTRSNCLWGPSNILPQWYLGALFYGVKSLDVNLTTQLPFSAELKNAWSYTSTLPYVFIRLRGLVLSTVLV
jgi:hypothetical protein